MKQAFLLGLILAAAIMAMPAANTRALGQAPASSRSAANSQASAQGQTLFAASCASCHGLDGRGGERAPGIVVARVQRMSDAEISGIIANGIPETGMPAFRSLKSADLNALVSYIRVLQGHAKPEALPGDPAQGKVIFFGKGECSSCHMMRGEGGFLGPDLSAYGAMRSAKEIVDVLRDPRRTPDPAYRIADITTHNGQRLSGVVRNEDNFSVQLQTSDGVFHFFSRADLQNFEYRRDPAMPRNYGEKLTQKEIDDLVSYMISVGRQVKPGSASQDDDLAEEDFQ